MLASLLAFAALVQGVTPDELMDQITQIATNQQWTQTLLSMKTIYEGNGKNYGEWQGTTMMQEGDFEKWKERYDDREHVEALMDQPPPQWWDGKNDNHYYGPKWNPVNVHDDLYDWKPFGHTQSSDDTVPAPHAKYAATMDNQGAFYNQHYPYSPQPAAHLKDTPPTPPATTTLVEIEELSLDDMPKRPALIETEVPEVEAVANEGVDRQAEQLLVADYSLPVQESLVQSEESKLASMTEAVESKIGSMVEAIEEAAEPRRSGEKVTEHRRGQDAEIDHEEIALAETLAYAEAEVEAETQTTSSASLVEPSFPRRVLAMFGNGM